MIHNFRSKSKKDIESPSETIIQGINLLQGIHGAARSIPADKISTLLTSEDNFDNSIEKRV